MITKTKRLHMDTLTEAPDRLQKKSSGFTLIELMVGVILLTIIMTGMSFFSYASLATQQKSHNFSKGVALAKKHLENCRASLNQPDKFDSVSALITPLNPEISLSPVTEQVENTVFTINRVFKRGELGGNAIKFETRVTWKDAVKGNQNHNVKFNIHIRKKV